LALLIALLEHCSSPHADDRDLTHFYLIDDTANVQSVFQLEERPGSGTFYYLNDTAYDLREWKIFFDAKKTKPAAVSVCDQTTCTITNYWENGKIKGIEKFSNRQLIYAEYRCENGTLITRKSSPGAIPIGGCNRTSDTVYYCNGNFMITFDTDSNRLTLWHENGKKALEGIEKNCLNEGTWTEYDTAGQAVLYKRYDDGQLIAQDSARYETKNSKR
jgi:hypothetical protein